MTSSKSAPDIWRTTIIVPTQAVPAFESALEEHCETVTWFMVDQTDTWEWDPGNWIVEGYGRIAPDRGGLSMALELAAAACGVAVPEAVIEKVPDADWVGETLRNFPPIRAGRYFVHGSHYDEKRPDGAIALVIDAGTAFGSGEHATTYSCLKALDTLAKKRRFRRILDIGCGSGILAMAAAKTWPADIVMAADIDPEAARVARFNARRNGLAARMRAETADGYRHRAIAQGRPYDLILSNILARPLCTLAPALASHLAPGGMCVLSGLLGRSEAMVLSAHRAQGLSLVERVVHGEWHTLVLTRRNR